MDSPFSTPPSRVEYLAKLISGLEQTRDNLNYEMPFYKESDIQKKYAEKYLTAVLTQLGLAEAELNRLLEVKPS